MTTCYVVFKMKLKLKKKLTDDARTLTLCCGYQRDSNNLKKIPALCSINLPPPHKLLPNGQ